MLEYIEKETGKRIADLFDVIAGTSTGAILTLGLTILKGDKPAYTAKELKSIYFNYGKQIFKKSILSVCHHLISLGAIRYDIQNLKKVVESYFGKATLREIQKDIIIPAYDLRNRKAVFFETQYAKNEEQYNYKLVDIICAAAAAPTYFRPYSLNNSMFVDAGIYANNSAVYGMIELLERTHDCRDALVVSLGTGQYLPKYKKNEIDSWGLMMWARRIIDIGMTGQSQMADYQLNNFLNMDKKKEDYHYHRFQIKLPKNYMQMDNIKPENLRGLERLTEQYIKKNKQKFDTMISKLI